MTWDDWYASDPACWAWAAPTAGQTIDDWFDDLCALCGGKAETVDHCHWTGLVRGNLCRSCNRREGRHRGGIYQRYRERPPAVIVGCTRPYDDTSWSSSEPEAWVVEEFGEVPAEPAAAAVYLARVAAEGTKASRRALKLNNPLRKMGL